MPGPHRPQGTFLATVLAALILVTALRPQSGKGFIYTLGLHAGLVGFSILAMQVVLAARIRWVARPFGLDQLLRFHKAMALLGVLLLAAHPVLLAWGGGQWQLLWGWSQPWNIWLGKAALMLLFVTWVVSWFRERIGFEFEKWRRTHNILAVSLLGLGFLHGIVTGSDLEHPAMRVLWPLGAVVVAGVYAFHKLVRPKLLRSNLYQVVEVSPETQHVTTVKLAPPAGKDRFDYWPGQFHFVTFHCEHPEVPVEEHHWTISSSPTEGNFLTSTIKASGDFTAKLPHAKVGDTAEVLGPYGRFSYLLHPQESDLVMIAGGIGITPLMSMLRHMRDAGCQNRVLLLYGNRTESDIVFRQELEEVTQAGQPRLTVIHVLSRPGESWQGPRGHIDLDTIAEHCGSPSGKAFYVCAPPAMTSAVTAGLLSWGVPPQQNSRGEILALTRSPDAPHSNTRLDYNARGVGTACRDGRLRSHPRWQSGGRNCCRTKPACRSRPFRFRSTEASIAHLLLQLSLCALAQPASAGSYLVSEGTWSLGRRPRIRHAR